MASDDTKKTKTVKRSLLIALIIATVIIIIVLAVSIVTSIGNMVYSEREAYVEGILTTSAKVLDTSFDNMSEYSQLLASVTEENLPKDKDLGEFIEHTLSLMTIERNRFMLVDSKGRYYVSDGCTGKISAPEYYYSTSADEELYISTLTHHIDEGDQFVYRRRLNKPIETLYNGNAITVEYCAVLRQMSSVLDMAFEAFPSNINRFVLDETGLMLGRELQLGQLKEGSNYFKKIENNSKELRYGENAEKLVAAAKAGETISLSFTNNGEEYYGGVTPLHHKKWHLALIARGSDISTVYSQGMRNLMSRVFIISAAICVLGILIVFFFLRIIKERERLQEQEKINTALNKAATAAAEASMAKSTFLSNMSHDIRTPINGIVGMTAIALKEKNIPPKIEDCLNKIDGASHHLLSLINDVLDMSRIESGKTEITNKPVDIRTVFANCASIVRGQLEDRDLTFETDYDNFENPYLLGDELHIRQILINILGNSVKFTPDGGSIKLYACERPCDKEGYTTVHMELSDTGIGMKQEFLDHIWDAFTQADSAVRTNYKGTGLGMAITKSFVDLMGGEISAQSEYGKWTRFTVDIPLQIDAEHSASAILEDDNILPGLKDIKILLVEDNELNREIAVEILQDEGALVTEAVDGEKAVEMFQNNPAGTFDIILMDIQMPVMDGLTAAKTIRAIERADAGTIPIIAMTANAFEDDVRASREAGMNAHLSKPIDLIQLTKAVSHYYQKSKGENQ